MNADVLDSINKAAVDFLCKPSPQPGVKYDMNKPDYSLIPPNALDNVVKVLTLGSQKYSRDNWKLLEDSNNRYFAAAMRHLWARFRGEKTDPESGIDHGAHAICCILFMMEKDNNETLKFTK